METKEITIQKAFDTAARTTGYQYAICFLCFLVAFFDGFDLTIIGVTVPKIAEYLKEKPSALGLAMSAGQFGPLVGAILLGMAADRFGRRRTVILSALFFGLFTLLTVFITNVEELALLRFIAGIGLGGAVPLAMAYGAEFAPSRLRKTFVAAMFAGVSTGSFFGGLAAAFLLPKWGWQSQYAFGGIIPLILVVVLLFCLPESLEFLAAKGNKDEKIRKILMKVVPAIAMDKDYRFKPSQVKRAGAPVKKLFTEGRASITLLYWIGLIGAIYSLYILLSWVPTFLRQSGASVVEYSLAFAFLCLGTTISGFLVGPLMDKGKPFLTLQIGFVLGFFSLIMFGYVAGASYLKVVVAATIAGFFINGAWGGLLTMAAIAYPPDMRGTATGWAYAIAKIGAMLAPAVGGFMLAANWSVVKICTTNAFVGIAVALLTFVLQWRIRVFEKRHNEEEAATAVVVSA